MVDYSGFGPSVAPSDPSSPSSSHFNSSTLAPQFNHLQIDQSYSQNHQGGHQYQQQHYPSYSQGPPQLSHLNIPSSQSFNSTSTTPRSPTSPGGYSYSAANRPRPSLGGATSSEGNMGGGSFNKGTTTGGGGGGSGPPPVLGDSPTRVPRKSSLAATGGIPSSSSHERLPPLPTSSSSMHFPKNFDRVDDPNQRDSSGGEAVFNGAALTSSSNMDSSRSFASPPPSQQPETFASPPPPSSSSKPTAPTSKKANPLEDLIATETLYVEDLGGVIKRVAAAWSRSNFPPPALDTMFRAVEAVYRINKTLLGKLMEIGPNPSSPKALGDLLMRWISDIEPAYSRYGSTLLLDFDSYPAVQSNPKLAPILASLPWPGTLPSYDQYDLTSPQVSLDRLFELPVHRIRYYKKLYAKLLRSTQEGRSDHALLVSANEKLAKLEKLAEEGKGRSVLGLEEERRNLSGGGGEGESRSNEEQTRTQKPMPPRLDLKIVGNERSSGESARLDSPSSSSLRSSSATGTSTANTSAAAHSAGVREPPLRVDELERRLSTERTLDIFSMQPRKCKLQMQPPSLTFHRQLRKASSAVISFIPASDPSRRQVIHPRAYVILLTDLFLLCEWSLPNEMSSPNQDLSLLYPPLAGKHLRVSESANRADLEVSIMGKESLTIRFSGGEGEARDWKVAMEEAARFGQNHTLSLRADSNSSAQPKSPLSPISTAVNPIPRVLSPSNETLSPIQSQYPSFPNANNSSSEPTSPNSNYSRQDSFNALGAPPQQPQSMYQNDPRSYGQAPAIPRPDRNASIARNQSPNGFVPSPSSSSFPGDNGSRGASPLRSDFNAPPPVSYPSHQQQSPYQNGRQSPYQIHPQPGDFGPPGPRGGNNDSRPSSRTSQNSFGSSSNRTDRSSGYPEPPPPLPKERSYNGLNISGRGGPIYPTSMRTDPGDSRSVSGNSDYLSPHNSVHRSKSAEALRIEPPQHYRMPSQAMSDERSASNPAFASSLGSRIGGEDDSPPQSPVDAQGPQKTSIVADMRCKIFLQQHHSVWKSLGTAKLKLYQSMPSNTKQLVVDSDKSKGKTLISTIVLTDGVERVGKTGVAIELSDQGDRTGIIYMLQMKTEQSATGLFDQLLIGSDRARR